MPESGKSGSVGGRGEQLPRPTRPRRFRPRFVFPCCPPFRTRVSHHFDRAPFPLPAHRTGRALLTHPALGQGSITPSHTKSCRATPEGHRAPGLHTSSPSGIVSSRDRGPCTWPSAIGEAGTARDYPRGGRLSAPCPAESSSPSPSV